MPSPYRHLKSLAGIALVLCGFSLGAQPSPELPEFELIPSGPVSIDERSGEVVATQGAQILYDDWILTADTIRFNQQTGEAHATGNVVFSRADLRLIADSLLYRPAEPFARVERFRAGNGRIYVDGSLLQGNPDNFQFQDINFYPGEPGTFLFIARAGELALEDGNVVRGKRLFFKVGAVPFLLIPNITQPLDAETNLFKPTLDYSGHIGAAIGAEALLPVGNDLRLGGNVTLASKRGVLVGPAATYGRADEDRSFKGSFISGFIEDQANPGFDVNGDPIDRSRGFAEWRHQQTWAQNRLSLSSFARYWSDSEVTRDFYESSFNQMQDPDSFLEAAYDADNWQLSFFTRAALNDFQSHTERLPELRFQYFPTPVLLKGLTHSGFLSAAKLRLAATSDKDVSGDRLDAFYGLDYAKPLRDGINLRLKAGARGIRYENAETYIVHPSLNPSIPDFVAQNSVSGTRAFGDVGADLSLKAVGTFDFENKTWGIQGLRHIFEPRLSYRYQPELWNDTTLRLPTHVLPAIYGSPYGASALHAEPGAFASYLPDLDLENRRDVENLREDHKLRLQLRNRFQTRHKDGGSRDLARLDIAAERYLPGSHYAEDYQSLVHFDFELSPAPWLAFNLFARLDPEDGFSNQELNTRVTIQDQGYWKASFGSHFLDGRAAAQFLPSAQLPFAHYRPWQTWPNFGLSYPSYDNPRLEQYFAQLEYSFSENLKAFAIARYDSQSGVFYDQRIGLMQRALERYGISYELRIYEGDRRERDFGISIGIELFDR